jgi:hypothetical protein
VVLRYDLELLRAEEGTEFLVRDGTGKALVRADRPSVLATGAKLLRRGTFEPWHGAGDAFMRSYGARATPHYQPGLPMNYRELAISEGDEISVSGAADWALDPEPDASAGAGYREPPKRLEIARRGNVAVTLGDPPEKR